MLSVIERVIIEEKRVYKTSAPASFCKEPTRILNVQQWTGRISASSFDWSSLERRVLGRLVSVVDRPSRQTLTATWRRNNYVRRRVANDL